MKSTIRNMEIDRWDSEIDNFIDLGIRNGEKKIIWEFNRRIHL
jgi:hypothetical protein